MYCVSFIYIHVTVARHCYTFLITEIIHMHCTLEHEIEAKRAHPFGLYFV